MNNNAIKTYEDLEREEQRLTEHLATLKITLKDDIQGVKAAVKEKLNPLKKVKQTARNLFVRDGENGPAINFALNFVMDYIIRLFIPNRSNVLTKTVIPFITKNYVSNLITEDQRKAVMKVVNEAVGKVDHLIRKVMKKKQESKYEEVEKEEIQKVEPVFTPVNNVNTNPMNL